MTLRPPYLLFGFDVDPRERGAAGIIADVERDFPITKGILPFGVANLYAVEVPPSQMTAKLRQVGAYLAQKDRSHQGMLRWVVQLCRSSEVSGG